MWFYLRTFRIALASLGAAKLRSFLTVLGIVIGVAAVIMVMGIGRSAQELVLSQVNEVGSDLIGILPGASEEDSPPAQAFGIITRTLVNDDLKAIRDRTQNPHILAAAGYVTGNAVLETRRDEKSVSYQGVSPSLPRVENIRVEHGRFFLESEEFNLARVAVLGSDRAAELFPHEDPIGARITLKDMPFEVVGVLEEQDATAFSNPNTAVYVPLGTAQQVLLGIDYLNFARAKVDGPENVEAAIADTEDLLRRRHDLDAGEESDFSIRSTAAALEILSSVTDVLTYFLAAIAGISLLVGGIGIMNSMLIAVSQRIREIGLRKAVGARSNAILQQFLLESVFLTLLGGTVGIALGIGLTYVAALAVAAFGYEWQFLVPFSSVALGFCVSVAIGIFFGLYPARRASKVSAMEALRYE